MELRAQFQTRVWNCTWGARLVASNANWRTNANSSEIAASGVAPANDHEASLQIDLEPGTYTAIVSSEDTNSGVGLVEVYRRRQSYRLLEKAAYGRFSARRTGTVRCPVTLWR